MVKNQVTQIEKRKRGLFGWVVGILFYGFPEWVALLSFSGHQISYEIGLRSAVARAYRGRSMIRIVTAAVAWAFLATAAQAEGLHRGPYLQDGGHGCRNETAIPVHQVQH